jgi:hypothetical protein
MRRLAVASALTLPMMVALAPSALAAKPTHQRLPSTPPTPNTPAALALMSRCLLVGWRAAGFVHKPLHAPTFSGRCLGWD